MFVKLQGIRNKNINHIGHDCCSFSKNSSNTWKKNIDNKGYDFWNRTYYPSHEDSAKKRKSYFIIDAHSKILGRLASLAAAVIRGKKTQRYHPAVDMGDRVIVINAGKVKVTGNKLYKKTYFRHTQNKRSGAGRI